MKKINLDNKRVLICMRTADLTSPAVRSTRQKCAKCNEEIWSSPASMIAIGGDGILICHVCAAPEITKNGGDNFQGITKGQARETGLNVDEIPSLNATLKYILGKMKEGDA